MIDGELFSTVIDLSSEAVWMLDVQKNESNWLFAEKNRIKFDLPDEVQPDFWSSRIHPDEREKITQGFNKALHNPRADSYSHEYLFWGADQFYRIYDRMKFIRDDEGNPLRVIGVWSDVTQERKNEASLKATINNIDTRIWSVDRNYRLIAFNDAFSSYVETMYGQKPVVGNEIIKPLSGPLIESRKFWHNLYDKALLGDRILERTRFMTQHYEIALNPICENEQVVGVAIAAEDITERLIQEHQVKKSCTEVAKFDRKVTEFQLMALRSAMNPHFIFNSLSSIQYYIANSDKHNAMRYLSTFSRLIRSILHNSFNNTATLASELDMLRQYTELERLRFKEKFDVVFLIDERIDTDNVLIPSLLIQPFVENAIVHGLARKEGKGFLSIAVYPKNDWIYIEIEDNGIGRKAAAQFKSDKFHHMSVGSRLTIERLKALDKTSKATVQFIDLENEGAPAGTKVRMCINPSELKSVLSNTSILPTNN